METKDYQVSIIVKDTGETVLRQRTIKAAGAMDAARYVAESYFGGEQDVQYWADAGTAIHYLCEYDDELRIVVGKVSNWESCK